MKRICLWVLFVMVFLLLWGQEKGFAGDRLTVVVSGNYLAPWDKDFKDFYGKGHLYPEVKAGFKIFRRLYLWAGYGLFSVKGETAVLNLEAKSTQNFLSGGVGYLFNLGPKIDYKGEAGVVRVGYKEEAMGEEASDSALGFRLDNALVYHLSRTFSVEISVGFLTASDTLNDLPVKLGGFKTGIGLGVTF